MDWKLAHCVNFLNSINDETTTKMKMYKKKQRFLLILSRCWRIVFFCVYFTRPRQFHEKKTPAIIVVTKSGDSIQKQPKMPSNITSIFLCLEMIKSVIWHHNGFFGNFLRRHSHVLIVWDCKPAILLISSIQCGRWNWRKWLTIDKNICVKCKTIYFIFVFILSRWANNISFNNIVKAMIRRKLFQFNSFGLVLAALIIVTHCTAKVQESLLQTCLSCVAKKFLMPQYSQPFFQVC